MGPTPQPFVANLGLFVCIQISVFLASNGLLSVIFEDMDFWLRFGLSYGCCFVDMCILLYYRYREDILLFRNLVFWR